MTLECDEPRRLLPPDPDAEAGVSAGRSRLDSTQALLPDDGGGARHRLRHERAGSRAAEATMDGGTESGRGSSMGIGAAWPDPIWPTSPSFPALVAIATAETLTATAAAGPLPRDLPSSPVGLAHIHTSAASASAGRMLPKGNMELGSLGAGASASAGSPLLPAMDTE